MNLNQISNIELPQELRTYYQTERKGILSLPNDLLSYLVTYFPRKDLRNFEGVSKRIQFIVQIEILHHFVQGHEVWKIPQLPISQLSRLANSICFVDPENSKKIEKKFLDYMQFLLPQRQVVVLPNLLNLASSEDKEKFAALKILKCTNSFPDLPNDLMEVLFTMMTCQEIRPKILKINRLMFQKLINDPNFEHVTFNEEISFVLDEIKKDHSVKESKYLEAISSLIVQLLAHPKNEITVEAAIFIEQALKSADSTFDRSCFLEAGIITILHKEINLTLMNLCIHAFNQDRNSMLYFLDRMISYLNLCSEINLLPNGRDYFQTNCLPLFFEIVIRMDDYLESKDIEFVIRASLIFCNILKMKHCRSFFEKNDNFDRFLSRNFNRGQITIQMTIHIIYILRNFYLSERSHNKNARRECAHFLLESIKDLIRKDLLEIDDSSVKFSKGLCLSVLRIIFKEATPEEIPLLMNFLSEPINLLALDDEEDEELRDFGLSVINAFILGRFDKDNNIVFQTANIIMSIPPLDTNDVFTFFKNLFVNSGPIPFDLILSQLELWLEDRYNQSDSQISLYSTLNIFHQILISAVENSKLNENKDWLYMIMARALEGDFLEDPLGDEIWIGQPNEAEKRLGNINIKIIVDKFFEFLAKVFKEQERFEIQILIITMLETLALAKEPIMLSYLTQHDQKNALNELIDMKQSNLSLSLYLNDLKDVLIEEKSVKY